MLFHCMQNFFSDKTNELTINEEINDHKFEEWFASDYNEGQLAIDVYQTATELIVKSTIAGTKLEDVEISLHNDMLTIRGIRHNHEAVDPNEYLYRECFWGNFSRTIILPVEIDSKKIKATLIDGVLTIKMLKLKVSKNMIIKVSNK